MVHLGCIAQGRTSHTYKCFKLTSARAPLRSQSVALQLQSKPLELHMAMIVQQLHACQNTLIRLKWKECAPTVVKRLDPG